MEGYQYADLCAAALIVVHAQRSAILAAAALRKFMKSSPPHSITSSAQESIIHPMKLFRLARHAGI